MMGECLDGLEQKIKNFYYGSYMCLGVPIVGPFAAGFAATYYDLPPPASVALAVAPVPTMLGINKFLIHNYQGSGTVESVYLVASMAATVICEGAGLLAGYLAKNL
jgi:hypothetical protein